MDQPGKAARMKSSCPATENKIAGDRRDNGHAGRDLAEGGNIFRILAEKSSDLLTQLRVSPELKVIYVNPPVYRITGYTREECYENPELVLRNIHPDDAGQLINILDPDTPDPSGPIVLQGVKKDGTPVWVELTRTVIRDTSANTVDIFLSCRDITRRRRTMEALKDSQEFVSSLLENAPHAIIVINPDTSVRYVNPIWEETNGWRLDEIIGVKAPYPWWPEEQREVFTKNFKPAMEQGRGKGEVVAVKKSGERYWLSMNWTTVRDDGKIRYMLLNSSDITERKRAEEELQEHKRLIENILSSLPEGVLVTDGQDRVVLANEAFHRIFHLAKKTVQTRPFQELIHMDGLDDLCRSVRQGNAARKTLELRCRMRGREKIIACNVVSMDGDRLLLIFSDVSQEREDKEKLYLTDRLASLGQMAAGLAHELNNPLTAILTLSQLLLHHGLPGEGQEDMKCIYEEAQRATRIVKDVLLFARNNNYEKGHASANDVVRDVLRLRQHDETASSIEVVTRLAGDMPDISIDRFQLQQVFLNIILNAEGAIKEAGRPGRLTVTSERDGDRVKIHFADNGCGIKKSVMPRIFDPFFTTKDIGSGTGLGLSICYGIVVKHGGRISVRSQPGEGATFTIEIPVVQA
jgi:two-component system NtrC family sensor kinase